MVVKFLILRERNLLNGPMEYEHFSGESRKRVGHPAPFPVELPKRCIKLFTFVGDTVLDPFLGSGSALLRVF